MSIITNVFTHGVTQTSFGTENDGMNQEAYVPKVIFHCYLDSCWNLKRKNYTLKENVTIQFDMYFEG